MSVLFVGDSILEKFKEDEHNLSDHYETPVDIDCASGRDLMEAFNTLPSLLKPSHGVVLVTTFVTEFWELVSFSPEYDVKVFSPKLKIEMEKMKDKMTMIAQLCKLKNNQLNVWFCFPPIMDMYKYNQSCLSKYPQLLASLQNHHTLNAENMARRSRAFHHLLYSLSNSHSKWGDDNRHISGQSIVHKYNEDNSHWMAKSEVLRYIKGEIYHLDLPDLLPDGMHLSSQFFYQLFKSYGNKLSLKAVKRDEGSKDSLGNQTLQSANYSQVSWNETVKTLTLGPEVQDPLIEQFIDREIKKLIENAQLLTHDQTPSYTKKILKTIVAETLHWKVDD